MSVDEETVRRVARLARIAVSDEEAAPLAQDLSRILDWVEQLGEVDVDAVEPMTGVTPMRLKMRDDVVTTEDGSAAALSNAPSSAEGFFVVPKVVE